MSKDLNLEIDEAAGKVFGAPIMNDVVWIYRIYQDKWFNTGHTIGKELPYPFKLTWIHKDQVIALFGRGLAVYDLKSETVIIERNNTLKVYFLQLSDIQLSFVHWLLAFPF